MGHVVQAELAADTAYLPTPQVEQSVLPAAADIFPAAQLTQTVPPWIAE